MRKKRILWVGEYSLLSTGFSTYAYQVLSKWNSTGKYELAELASFAEPSDRRLNLIPWKIYPVLPPDGQPKLHEIFNAKQTNQFGEWIFDDVCLEFKPDIVVDMRDAWMYEYQERSCSREFFHWILLPTVDSSPQEDNWIATFMNADAVLPQNEWGYNVLKTQSNGEIKLKGTSSPGANLDAFKLRDKKTARQQVGLPDDIFIIGTVMRNQVRKLYPDLMEAFAKFLTVAPQDILLVVIYTYMQPILMLAGIFRAY